MKQRRKIAVIGGTGDLGRGLARRWAACGHEIVIGSRDASRAAAAAATLAAEIGEAAAISGLANRDAAAAGEIVVLAVPFASHAATLEDLRAVVQGKILVDVTVPLVPPKVMRVQLPAGGSAAKSAQALLGAGVRVVSAFQNVAADHLAAGRPIDCDVLVAGDEPAARAVVIELAEDIGLKAWHAGPIDNSAVAEALTSVLIFLNKHYKIDGAGIRITGKPNG
jgi:NADPH-dependent F420 reductase